MSQTNDLLPTTFVDSRGEQWTIPCDVNSIVRVAHQTGIKLTDLINVNSESYRKWIEDFPATQVAVLYALVSDEARDRGLSPEDVGRRLASQDAFDQALRAITNAVINFSPQSRRNFLRQAFPKAEAAFEKLREQEAKNLDERIEAVDWDGLMRDTLTDSSSATDSPESSVSTPGLEPSENST